MFANIWSISHHAGIRKMAREIIQSNFLFDFLPESSTWFWSKPNPCNGLGDYVCDRGVPLFCFGAGVGKRGEGVYPFPSYWILENLFLLGCRFKEYLLHVCQQRKEIEAFGWEIGVWKELEISISNTKVENVQWDVGRSGRSGKSRFPTQKNGPWEFVQFRIMQCY